MTARKLFIPILLLASLHAQQPSIPPGMHIPKPVPVPPLPPISRVAAKPPPEPADPPAQTVADARTHLSFRLPPGWNVSHKDGEISTFRLDARSAPHGSELRAVASLGFNPFPTSTFSGANFYLSVVPRSSTVACAAETRAKPDQAMEPVVLGDVKFSRGKDEHGHICTEVRDVAYTAMRGGSCVRFDLAVNSFCGGEVSGAQDLTEAQLGSLFQRLEGILDSVRFTPR